MNSMCGFRRIFYSHLCKESKTAQESRTKELGHTPVNILLLEEDVLLYNEHLRSSICNKQGR